MLAGTASSLLLIYFSPAVQLDVLGRTSAPFPLKNPALVSLPLAALTALAVSRLWPEREAQARFAEIERRVHLGA
jgi:cation/acetate symporter